MVAVRWRAGQARDADSDDERRAIPANRLRRTAAIRRQCDKRKAMGGLFPGPGLRIHRGGASRRASATHSSCRSVRKPGEGRSAALAGREASGVARARQEERPAGLGEDDRQGRRSHRHGRQEARHPHLHLGAGQQDAAVPAGQRRRRELPRLRRRPRLRHRARLHRVSGRARRGRVDRGRSAGSDHRADERAQPSGDGCVSADALHRCADPRRRESRQRRRLQDGQEPERGRRAGDHSGGRDGDLRARQRAVAVALDPQSARRGESRPGRRHGRRQRSLPRKLHRQRHESRRAPRYRQRCRERHRVVRRGRRRHRRSQSEHARRRSGVVRARAGARGR